MKAFKSGFLYFIKTQLLIIIVFNLLLAIAYVFLLAIMATYFNMIERNPNNTIAVELMLVLTPTLIFFVCGLYYKQKRKPVSTVARYLPIVFPIIYLLFVWLFYSKIFVSGFSEIPWLQLPYHWVFYTPIGFFLTENSELANMDDNFIFFEWIMPLINYFLFLIGYTLGDKPIVIRIFKKAKERLWF